MAKLTSQQANRLANDFLGLAQAIGDFRYKNWDKFSKAKNKQLGDLQWSILNDGEDILALSTTLVMDEAAQSLEQIHQITREINKGITQLQDIQKGIDLAAAIVTLGAAILSKQPAAITGAISGVVDTWYGSMKA